MIRNIRNRFPARRWLRILGWTTVATAWVTAVTTHVVAASLPVTPPVTSPPAVVDATVATEPIPLMPGQGLVVLRSTPAPAPEPEIVVAPAPAGGSTPAATVSSGS